MSSRNLVCWLLALGFGLGLTPASRAELKVGDTFPALDAAGLVSLTQEKTPQLGEVTLVDFWASWCAPCKASFPAMARLHHDFASRGLRIIAISIDEKPGAAAAFWLRMGATFSGWHDASQSLVRTVSVPTMPTSYLLDRSGRVRHIEAGYRGEVSDLRKQIEALLP